MTIGEWGLGIGPNPHFILGKYPKIVICPKCKDVCILNIKNYKINLTGCKNGHNTRNIFLNDFKETQMIKESKIICEDCKTNTKLNAYKNQFYKCFTCKKNLCLLCQKKNHNEHIIVDYEYKDYFCEIHGENYIYYCTLCNINLCDICEHDDKHKIINLKILIKKKKY